MDSETDLQAIEHRFNTMPRRTRNWDHGSHDYNQAVALTK